MLGRMGRKGNYPTLLVGMQMVWLLRKVDYKENKPVSLKGNQPGIFIGKTDAEAEDPILWPPDAKN